MVALSPPAKRRLFTAFAWLLSLCLVVAFLETWGWLHVYRPFDAFLPSSRFHHTRKPNSVIGPKKYFSFNPMLARRYPETARWHYNAQGWLHPEDVSTSKPTGVYRIFYLGDSFTEGQTLEQDSMPRVVGERLTELATGDAGRLEVINAGTVSYSPILHFILMRYKLMEFEPDLLVVNVDMTDDHDEWKYRKDAVFDENGDPVAVPFLDVHLASYVDTASGTIRSTGWTRVLLFLYTKSYFFTYLQYVGLGLSDPSNAAEAPLTPDTLYDLWAWCREEWDQSTEETVSILLDTLGRIVRYCRQHNVRIMITAAPYYQQYHADESGQGPPEYSARPHYELEKLCRKLEVPYLNSYEALKPFIEGSPKNKFYIPGDIHFNAEGNRLWAEQQARFLMDPSHNLLPRDVTGP